jgi:hypothetical protein
VNGVVVKFFASGSVHTVERTRKLIGVSSLSLGCVYWGELA